MGFNPTIKEQSAIASKKLCSICHKFCGVKMEFHHIHQKADGGENSFENCIPVCFDCHGDLGHYNTRHAKGKKYATKELMELRDDHYKKVKDGYYNNVKYDNSDIEDIKILKNELNNNEIIYFIEQNDFICPFESNIFFL